MSLLIYTVLIGVGATALMDFWAVVRKRLFGIAAPDYGLVGRWLGHMPSGQFRHQRISAAAPISGERAIGRTAHYLIGIGFAALLVGIWDIEPASRAAIRFWIISDTPRMPADQLPGHIRTGRHQS